MRLLRSLRIAVFFVFCTSLAGCGDFALGGEGAGDSSTWFYSCSKRIHSGKSGTYMQSFNTNIDATSAASAHTAKFGPDHKTTVYQGD